MSYTCPYCGWTSHNPSDEKYRYCGNCQVFEDDERTRLELQSEGYNGWLSLTADDPRPEPSPAADPTS